MAPPFATFQPLGAKSGHKIRPQTNSRKCCCVAARTHFPLGPLNCPHKWRLSANSCPPSAMTPNASPPASVASHRSAAPKSQPSSTRSGRWDTSSNSAARSGFGKDLVCGGDAAATHMLDAFLIRQAAKCGLTTAPVIPGLSSAGQRLTPDSEEMALLPPAGCNNLCFPNAKTPLQSLPCHCA
jgi:hypothetical protein